MPILPSAMIDVSEGELSPEKNNEISFNPKTVEDEIG